MKCELKLSLLQYIVLLYPERKHGIHVLIIIPFFIKRTYEKEVFRLHCNIVFKNELNQQLNQVLYQQNNAP